MLSWNNSITFCQKRANDSSASALVDFKMMMNHWYKYILAELNRPVIEKTKTGLTVANQQGYQCPPDFFKPKSVTVTIGTIAYPLAEEASQDNWNVLNTYPRYANIPERFFARPRFGIGGYEIAIWPIPSGAGNTIKIVYEATDKDLQNDSYTTGTISTTNGSNIITGSGTTFITPMVGRYLKVTSETGDGFWYRIAGKNSPTELVLENYYDGETVAGQNYTIDEMFNIPEEMQLLPCYGALQNYFEIKGNQDQELKYKTLFDEGIKKGKERWGNKSANVRIDKRYQQFNGTYPAFFPRYIS